MPKLTTLADKLLTSAVANGIAAGASTNVSLGNDQKVITTNRMNMNNPMLAYTRGLQVVENGVGATTFK